MILAIEVYLLNITAFFSVMSTFEIFLHYKFGMAKCVIPNFRVSTAILNPVGIFLRWYYFRLLQGQVLIKPFFWISRGKEKIFLFLIHISRNNWLETKLNNPFVFGKFKLSYLLNGIGLDWHMYKSGWIQKIPKYKATNNINIWFVTHNKLFELGKLELVVLLTNR